jgi:flagellar hook-associated protein 3 FlgL
MYTRMTTGMTQRNVLSDLNSLSTRLAATQSKAASGKEITRPSDDPFGTGRAMSLRASLASNQQYQSNVQDAQGWQNATEAALDSITKYVNRAHDMLVQGGSDSTDATDRKALAAEIDEIINGVKETANADYGGRYVLSGTATNLAPYKVGPDDTYQGDDAGLDPAVPGVLREIGPGVTMSINTVGREILGDGSANPTDGKLISQLRAISDHLKTDDGASLRTTDMDGLKDTLNTLLGVRARNGAQTNRLDAAATRLQDLELASTEQLSNIEDADLSKTLIDFNSQSTAYQAALRAGANLVQSSLMDFLR